LFNFHLTNDIVFFNLHIYFFLASIILHFYVWL
jgi:hypothetical protein